MSKMSLAEILNPSEWRRYRDHELKIEIEGHKYRQRDEHHRDEMDLGYRKLHQDSQEHRDQIELGYRRLEGEAQEHRDRMTALARRDELDERRISGGLSIDRDRLEFDKQNALLSHQVALRTAEIQAQNALDLAHLNHTHAMQLASQQAHAEVMKAAALLPIAATQSALTRGEDQNRAISGAIADVVRAKINQKMAEKLEDQRERHRANERKHEIEIAILRAGLDRFGFTHQEITKLVIRLMDPTTATPDENELFNRYEAWYNNTKAAFD
jgi:type I site-specific restriction endonuclease